MWLQLPETCKLPLSLSSVSYILNATRLQIWLQPYYWVITTTIKIIFNQEAGCGQLRKLYGVGYKVNIDMQGLQRKAILFFINNCEMFQSFNATIAQGGTSPNVWQPGSAYEKKCWTQSDLRFCENEGSKTSKINEKGWSIGLKIKMKIDTKCLKSVK